MSPGIRMSQASVSAFFLRPILVGSHYHYVWSRIINGCDTTEVCLAVRQSIFKPVFALQMAGSDDWRYKSCMVSNCFYYGCYSLKWYCCLCSNKAKLQEIVQNRFKCNSFSRSSFGPLSEQLLPQLLEQIQAEEEVAQIEFDVNNGNCDKIDALVAGKLFFGVLDLGLQDDVKFGRQNQELFFNMCREVFARNDDLKCQLQFSGWNLQQISEFAWGSVTAKRLSLDCNDLESSSIGEKFTQKAIKLEDVKTLEQLLAIILQGRCNKKVLQLSEVRARLLKSGPVTDGDDKARIFESNVLEAFVQNLTGAPQQIVTNAEKVANMSVQQIKQETIIVFDIDDTLVPSVWMELFKLDRPRAKWTQEQRSISDKIKDEACMLLEEACRIAKEVFLLTNGSYGWIRSTPLYKALYGERRGRGIPVDSAVKDKYPGLQPVLYGKDNANYGSLSNSRGYVPVRPNTKKIHSWYGKKQEILRVMEKFVTKNCDIETLNIIGVGDSEFDRVAMNKAVTTFREKHNRIKVRCKTLKLRPPMYDGNKSEKFGKRPEVLRNELQSIREGLRSLVDEKGAHFVGKHVSELVSYDVKLDPETENLPGIALQAI